MASSGAFVVATDIFGAFQKLDETIAQAGVSDVTVLFISDGQDQNVFFFFFFFTIPWLY